MGSDQTTTNDEKRNHDATHSKTGDRSNMFLNSIEDYKQGYVPLAVMFTVTFKNWDGTTIEAQEVEQGKSATAPRAPARDRYDFIGWDASYENVQSDITCTAQYQKQSKHYENPRLVSEVNRTTTLFAYQK